MLQLLHLPRLTPDKIDALVDATRAVAFSQLTLLGDYAAAECEGLRVLETDPANFAIRSGLAELLVRAEAYADAAAHYRVLLGTDWYRQNEPLIQARLANNYAWALCCLGDASSLDSADRWSAFAHGLLPFQAPVIGTRGAVLVERGNVAEGSALLRKSLSLHISPGSRATNYAYLAVGCAREGRLDEAEAFLRSAETADRDSNALARARAVVDQRLLAHRATVARS